MYIQTRQVANDEKVNLGGYFTSQYIFFSHLTPYLKRKQEAQHKSLCLIKTMQEPPQHRQQQRRYAETGCSFSDQAVKWWDHLPACLPIHSIHKISNF